MDFINIKIIIIKNKNILIKKLKNDFKFNLSLKFS